MGKGIIVRLEPPRVIHRWSKPRIAEPRLRLYGPGVFAEPAMVIEHEIAGKFLALEGPRPPFKRLLWLVKKLGPHQVLIVRPNVRACRRRR